MVDYKKLMEEDAKKTPEDRQRERDESFEKYLDELTLRFSNWVKRYPLEIDFVKCTLTITSNIDNWSQFYSEAQDYGFRYVGGKRLISSFDNDDNLILRLNKLRHRGD